MNRIELFNVLHVDASLDDGVSNPFFQSRLIRIYAKVKVGCRLLLGQLSFEEFLTAYNYLELLLEVGGVVGKHADLSLSQEARELKWCHYLTLKNLYENHGHVINGLSFNSKFTDLQMFALVALNDLGCAEQALLKLNVPYRENVEFSCSQLIEFSSSLLGAEEALNHMFELLTFRVTGKKIETLAQEVQKNTSDKAKGGKESRYKKVMPLFVEEADKKWKAQAQAGEKLFRKKDMCSYLLELLNDNLPLSDSSPPKRIKPSESVIWDEWLSDVKPKDARNKSQNK